MVVRPRVVMIYHRSFPLFLLCASIRGWSCAPSYSIERYRHITFTFFMKKKRSRDGMGEEWEWSTWTGIIVVALVALVGYVLQLVV